MGFPDRIISASEYGQKRPDHNRKIAQIEHSLPKFLRAEVKANVIRDHFVLQTVIGVAERSTEKKG